MGYLIPFRNERLQPLRQRRLVGEIGDPQPFPLQDAEPLLDVPAIMPSKSAVGWPASE
jgi:hypothetical protein